MFKRFLLLLSATPVQNDLVELYNIMTLLKPGMFRTLKEFRAAYITPGKPREPANAERLRELMRGAMIRNTRAVVALKLPRRHAVTIKVDGHPGEGEAYADLAAAARRIAAGTKAGGHRLALQHMFGAAGSSPAAAAAAVARFAARRHNYALRVSVEWVQGLELFVPVQRFQVLVKRRKGEKLIHLDWHPAVRLMEPPPSDWGLGVGRSRLVCDDQLHITDPAGQAPCPSCGWAWCRACHPTACRRCGHAMT